MTGKQKEVVEMGFGEKVQPEELETPDRKPPTKQPCKQHTVANCLVLVTQTSGVLYHVWYRLCPINGVFYDEETEGF